MDLRFRLQGQCRHDIWTILDNSGHLDEITSTFQPGTGEGGAGQPN